MSKWIDISQPLDDKIARWPGDTPFSYEVNWSKEETGSVNVGKITMSIHTGTHIDAPFHFDSDGKKVIDLDLDLYIGRTKVVHIPANKSIGINELSDVNLKSVTRLLIRTDAWQDRSVFPETIPYIEPSLASYLAKFGIRLLGIDLPSVDPLDSKELAAHHELAYHKIHILEGVLLDKIPSGDYELIAAPLPLVEADGSPVRALLKKATIKRAILFP
ncbi:arylformamidase [Priestia megaterium]|uniref:Kynurenine formamidase n=1 Tax=Priestia megaterium (strain ATCC 14581 / DSM 32 / CCUG 1817 / JCM 2506 / NBRC 15308 / NCIMB 9376 / NCTC 10342 / NRRL B-14308 / VKM B-512 / Ford 19) TaxID=1348623 RepID=A0A0B6AQV8_PRIM2|nr:arylformamidase [Priestia megaterium]AJI23023.1 arylformamidase [Priestia megaterium NBRC 15308 = ATCC 14581]KFN04955.1 arylformamidase [Priestia megaterium]KGJ78872.1 kynurenine formamidase [Priestia megaterium NBRC 15308 = ATCC 14581]MDR4234809.1 arylformamidase [Priestia megaterium]MED3805009.1 arylformamidase [Priestia megaterium]